MILIKKYFAIKIVSILTVFSILFNIFSFVLAPENDAGLNWEENTICVYKPENGFVSYPRMLSLNDGSLICGYGHDSKICCVKSFDGGLTWDKNETLIAEIPGLNCTNAAFVQLESGELLCGYRATGYRDGKFYGSLRVSSSFDNGITWNFHSIIIETLQDSDNFNGVWEPHFGFIGSRLAVYYSNDSLNDAVNSPEHQNIEYKLWDGSSWGEKHIASNGDKTNSRDGMPVWFQTSSGQYVMAIEATSLRNSKLFKRTFVIQLLTSDNGLDWSSGKTIYITPDKNKGIYAGAPYVVELPDGRLCVSFQTDENENSSWTARVITTKSPYDGNANLLSFTKSFAPFGKEDVSDWNGMLVYNNYLLVFTSKIDSEGSGILLRRAVL